MKKKYILQVLLLVPLIGNCQNFNIDNLYGYYIGISTSEIKNQSEIKHYMVLELTKNSYAINFNQLGDQRTFAYTDDIIAFKWDYQCTLSVLPDNSFQIKSNNFYFTLRSIDSLTLKIEGSTYLQYIGDTLYRVSARRFKGDYLANGWEYMPFYSQSSGDEIYILNSHLEYPQTPVWHYYNLEPFSHTYIYLIHFIFIH